MRGEVQGKLRRRRPPASLPTPPHTLRFLQRSRANDRWEPTRPRHRQWLDLTVPLQRSYKDSP